SEEQAREIIQSRGLALAELEANGDVPVVPQAADASAEMSAAPDPSANGQAHAPSGERRPLATMREPHENRELERLFQQLEALGVSIDDYAMTQEESVTGEKLPTKYAWELTGAVPVSESESADADADAAAAAGEGEDEGEEADAAKRAPA